MRLTLPLRLRNFALSLAAATLRLALPAALLGGAPFATAYAAVAWLCWLPQLLLLESALMRRPAVVQRVDLPA